MNSDIFLYHTLSLLFVKKVLAVVSSIHRQGPHFLHFTSTPPPPPQSLENLAKAGLARLVGGFFNRRTERLDKQVAHPLDCNAGVNNPL